MATVLKSERGTPINVYSSSELYEYWLLKSTNENLNILDNFNVVY